MALSDRPNGAVALVARTTRDIATAAADGPVDDGPTVFAGARHLSDVPADSGGRAAIDSFYRTGSNCLLD